MAKCDVSAMKPVASIKALASFSNDGLSKNIKIRIIILQRYMYSNWKNKPGEGIEEDQKTQINKENCRFTLNNVTL